MKFALKISASPKNKDLNKKTFDTNQLETNFENYTKEGRSFIKDNQYFSNCIFKSNIIDTILAQPICKDIMFTHAIASEKNGTKFSTLVASGVSNDRILVDETKVYISAYVNEAELDCSKINNFSFKRNLVSSPGNSEVEKQLFLYEKTPHLNLPFYDWVNCFNPKKIVRKNSNNSQRIKGIYFNKTEIINRGYLNYTYLALFPICLLTSWKSKDHLKVVTYVLVPINQNKQLLYPMNEKFLYSYDSWPHNWRDN